MRERLRREREGGREGDRRREGERQEEREGGSKGGRKRGKDGERKRERENSPKTLRNARKRVNSGLKTCSPSVSLYPSVSPICLLLVLD